jgi:hypothetical protein
MDFTTHGKICTVTNATSCRPANTSHQMQFKRPTPLESTVSRYEQVAGSSTTGTVFCNTIPRIWTTLGCWPPVICQQAELDPRKSHPGPRRQARGAGGASPIDNRDQPL